MSLEKEYDQRVKFINELRELLKRDPENKELRDKIRKEEDQLYKEAIKSSRELEEFLKLNNIDTREDDED